STAAFSSGPVLGAIGWLSENTLHLPHAPQTSPSPFAGLPRPERLKDIALVEVGMGEPEQTLELIAGSGFAGAVISGVGGGHVPESLLPAVTRLAEAMPVVLASRTGSGASLKRTYGYPGGEIGLLEAGLVPAGLLDARKARIVLTLTRCCGRDPAEAIAHFACNARWSVGHAYSSAGGADPFAGSVRTGRVDSRTTRSGVNSRSWWTSEVEAFSCSRVSTAVRPSS